MALLIVLLLGSFFSVKRHVRVDCVWSSFSQVLLGEQWSDSACGVRGKLFRAFYCSVFAPELWPHVNLTLYFTNGVTSLRKTRTW